MYIYNYYRCGIPMLKLSTPNSLEESKIVFRAGIKTSHPSRPNLFSLVHLLARNSSNLKGIHGGEIESITYQHNL